MYRSEKCVTGFALVIGLPKTLPERKWKVSPWSAMEIRFSGLPCCCPNIKIELTYSPPSVVITSASGGSFRTNVTVATVCRALMSTVIFHGVGPDGVASKIRIPLLTRALQVKV